MTTEPEPVPVASEEQRRNAAEDRAAAVEAEISELLLREIDAALARIEVGIAAERQKMDSLLERLTRPASA